MDILFENMLLTWCQRRQIELLQLLDTWMTSHKQYGDTLCYSSSSFLFFMLEHLSTRGFHWMEFFTSVKLKNSYVDEKMSPEPPST